jgi:hypothetical protein
MGANGSNSAATHFGRQMKKERLANNWSLRKMAAESGVDYTTLSRIETGGRPPNERVAAECDRLFPGRRGWFTDWMSESRSWGEIPPAFKSWAEVEQRATVLYVWAPGIIHGLFQTERYARVMLGTYPGVSGDVVAARLENRMLRQRRILYRPDPPEMYVVVDELALYRRVGSPAIMAEQVSRLLEVAELEHVHLMVMPAIEHPCTSSGMMIAEDAAYTESLTGGGTYTERATTVRLNRLFATLTGESYRASESRALLRRMRDTWMQLGESQPTRARPAETA